MNNPFSRLKHFIPDETDPQENHATESLASCLVFSPRIKEEFIRFLFPDERFKAVVSSQIEVVTQEYIQDGYIDLVLRSPDHFTIAIEVKVKSPENCEHHRSQLTRYRKWLEGEKAPVRFLFTLVRDRDMSFC